MPVERMPMTRFERQKGDTMTSELKSSRSPKISKSWSCDVVLSDAFRDIRNTSQVMLQVVVGKTSHDDAGTSLRPRIGLADTSSA